MFSFLAKLLGGGEGPARIDPRQARDRVAQGAVLLDVRTEAEFGAGHIPGALNVPVAELPRRTEEIDGSKGVVVYCRSGGRSARAASILRHAGIEDVHDLGPMSAWPREEAP